MRHAYTPNLRATQVELYDGLVSTSQNRWPSLRRDFGRVNDWLSPFFPAGFYYKTFMWPRTAWKALYEPVIRRAAGLGEAPSLPDPDRYAQRYAHCDVLVVGAGPAGISAALTAADGGARVMLCDEQAEFGGSLLGDVAARIDGDSGGAWVERSVASLRANPRVTLLARTTAFGYFPHNFIGLCERLSDHLPQPNAKPTARASLAGSRARRGARDGSDRAPLGLSGQRSAGNPARGSGANVSQSLRRAASANGWSS